MKKMYKAIALVLCAALLITGSVLGTLAYLKSQTGTMTNTFTAGKVEITLHEYEIDNTTGDKKLVNNEPVKAAATGLAGIKLVPGRVIEKNPVITVKGGSESCYLFVKVENGVPEGVATINWVSGDWTCIDTTKNIYCYKAVVTANVDTNNDQVADDVEISVFPGITCKSDVVDYSTYTIGDIKITAYAVQAEGFDNAAAAWTATFGKSVNN